MIPDEYIIYLEIFGYIGTALVIISMMMSSVPYLRIFNISGSIISMTYSFLCAAYPVAVMNLALIFINVFHLVRHFISKRTVDFIRTEADNPLLMIFLDRYGSDIKKLFPDAEIQDEIYMVTDSLSIVGVIFAKRENDTVHIRVSYTTHGYRSRYIWEHLFPALNKDGIRCVTVESAQNRKQDRHLRRLGFTLYDGKLQKIIHIGDKK